MIHHIFFKIMHETFENMTKQPNHIYIISHDKIRLVSCTIYRHQYAIPQYMKHCHYFLWWIWQPQELLFFTVHIFCSVWVEKKQQQKIWWLNAVRVFVHYSTHMHMPYIYSKSLHTLLSKPLSLGDPCVHKILR